MKDEKPIIKASTPNSSKYDTKIDIYTKNPREDDHESIHIAINSDDKSAHIIDTTEGKTEHTDIKCYLTTACMRHFQEQFDDNCYELRVLRWFRDNFVTPMDIQEYYEIAPLIVENIDKDPSANLIYDYIYDNVVDYCVECIENGNYFEAYSRYKSSIISLSRNLVKEPTTKKHLLNA